MNVRELKKIAGKGEDSRTLQENVPISKVEIFDLRRGRSNAATMWIQLMFFENTAFVVVAVADGAKMSKIVNFDLRRNLERRVA